MIITESKLTPVQKADREREEKFYYESGLNDPNTMPAMGVHEAIAYKEEEAERYREARRWKDHNEFLDAKRRMGRVMHHSEFIYRLRKIIPTLIVAPARQHGRLSLYRLINKLAGDGSHEYVEYITWIETGEMPEYEINLTNKANEAVGQRRGWRTILLRLQTRRDEEQNGKKGRKSPVITESQAVEQFGEPTNGETANNYRRQLWEFRNEY